MLTFTPRVEEHDDVLAAVVSCCRLPVDGAAGHRQPILATHGAGRWADGQLQLVAALLHNLGLPAFILQRIHKQNGGVGAFGHGGQRTCTTGYLAPECWTWITKHTLAFFHSSTAKYHCLLIRVMGACWNFSSSQQTRINPGEVRQVIDPSQGVHTIHSHTAPESPFKLMCMLLDCERKPEHPDRRVEGTRQLHKEPGLGYLHFAANAGMMSKSPSKRRVWERKTPDWNILSTKLNADMQHRFRTKHVALIKNYIYSTLARLHCRFFLRVYQETIVLHPAWTQSQEINNTQSTFSKWKLLKLQHLWRVNYGLRSLSAMKS